MGSAVVTATTARGVGEGSGTVGFAWGRPKRPATVARPSEAVTPRRRRIRDFFFATGALARPLPNSGGGGVMGSRTGENSSGGRLYSLSFRASPIGDHLLCTSTWGKGHSTPSLRKPSHRSRFRVRAPE